MACSTARFLPATACLRHDQTRSRTKQAFLPVQPRLSFQPVSSRGTSLSKGEVHSRRCCTSLRCSAESAPESSPHSAPESVNKVFVAGATGRTGIRIVRELTQRKIKVRAGVRDPERAERVFTGAEAPEGVGYNGQLGSTDKASEPIDMQLLELVRFDLTGDPAALKEAIGGADVVVAATGAPENLEALNPSLPRQIDGEGAIALVNAAAQSGVKHYLMVSSLGTGRFGLPASLLNLFWNVLEWKGEAEKALMLSGMKFTILRPGGMERPTDDYLFTHSTVVYPQDTQFGGQVSRRQVAELCAEAVCSPSASANKVLEIVAEEGVELAPLVGQMEAVDVNLANLMPPPGPRPPKDVVLDVMGFKGSGPEVVNGRLAMIGSLGIIIGQLQGQGSVMHQLGVHWGALLLWVLGVSAASLVPLVKGASVKDAEVGLFTARLEMFHGRAAMCGIGTMLVTELTSETHQAYLSFLPFVN